MGSYKITRNDCLTIILISFNKNVVNNYNLFVPLLDHIECLKCSNFGKKYHDCRSIALSPINKNKEEYFVRNRNQKTKGMKEEVRQAGRMCYKTIC